MVSIETVQAPATSPRISFSSELIDDDDDDDDDSFISINPNCIDQYYEVNDDNKNNNKGKGITSTTRKTAAEFEFLSSHNSMEKNQTMLTADELFFDGKLLPFWQMQYCSQKLNKITINSNTQKDQKQQEETEETDIVIDEEEEEDSKKKKNKEQKTEQEQPRISSSSSSNNGKSWLIDEDPSPRPPKCTVLWKELLKLKKQRANHSNNNNNKASSLSPSSSTSSSSSFSSSSSSSVGDNIESGRENNVKRVKKGLERTRFASIRIRPMVTVPLCTTTTTSHHVRTNSNHNLPPLFNKKGR